MRAMQLRGNISSAELRLRAKSERDPKLCRRLIAIAHILDGGTLAEARNIACVSEVPFRVWMHRYNAVGINGLKNKRKSGRPTKINAQVAQDLQSKVLSGPTELDGIVRYRIVDLQNYLRTTHGISMCVSGVWRKLQQLNLSWKTCRQRHPKANELAQEAFKKTSLSS